MKESYLKYYWIFILLLQAFLVIEKITANKFFVWNCVALFSSVIFLYYRIKLDKILLNPERVIILMIIINGITSVITNIILKTEALRMVITIIITIASIIIGNSIKDRKNNTL